MHESFQTVFSNPPRKGYLKTFGWKRYSATINPCYILYQKSSILFRSWTQNEAGMFIFYNTNFLHIAMPGGRGKGPNKVIYKDALPQGPNQSFRFFIVIFFFSERVTFSYTGSFKVPLWWNSRYPFLYIFVLIRSFLDILPNFNFLRKLKLVVFGP